MPRVGIYDMMSNFSHSHQSKYKLVCDLYNNPGRCFKWHVFKHNLITSFWIATSVSVHPNLTQHRIPKSTRYRKAGAKHGPLPSTADAAGNRWRSASVCVCWIMGQQNRREENLPKRVLTCSEPDFQILLWAVWISVGIWWERVDDVSRVCVFVSLERSGVWSHSGWLEPEDRQIESRAGCL